jgi:GntR family transcriptional regulator
VGIYAGAAMTETHRSSPTITPSSGMPLHRQLFLVLYDEIARGAMTVGEALPTEQTLCEQFGVSRITVRRALTDLAEQGLIERRQGVGSFVKTRERPTVEGHVGSYLDGLRRTDLATSAEVIEYRVGPAPAWVVDRLGLVEGLHILRVRRERRTGEPLMVTDAWLPAELAEKIDPAAMTDTPLYTSLSRAGVALGRLEHEISAEIAGPGNAQLLDVAIGAPLLRADRRVFTAAGAPHHVLSILLSPSRSRILLSSPGDQQGSGNQFAIAHDVPRA